MSRHFAVLSACLLALPPANADPQPRAPAGAVSFLPAAVGDTLVFEETRPAADGPTTRLVTRTVVEATAMRAGESVVAIREAKDGSAPKVEVYRQTDAGLFLALRDLHVFNPPCCVARLPLTAGDTWEVNDPAVFSGPIKFTTGEAEEVEVPAGKFQAVRIEKESVLRDGTRIRGTEWAAPGRASSRPG
jgi:hypothetical protein